MYNSNQLSHKVLKDLHDDAFKWALSCCGYDCEEAEEIMQSVYVEILSEKAVFRGESSLRTWLYAVIRRLAWQRARSQRIFRTLKSGLKKLMLQEKGMDTFAALVDAEHRSRIVLKALSEMSPKQRQIIELVYYRDFTLAEAAQIMGIGLGSTRTHFHRAKQAIAKRIEEQAL